MIPEWWKKPRNISVVVDNPSWILPYAQELVSRIQSAGDQAKLCRSHDEVMMDGIAFYLGCVKITPPDLLEKNYKNLVVHESALPEGRGFSPLTWHILDGELIIPITLLEAVEEVDSGNIIYQDELIFEGHELIAELRAAQALKTVELCMRYIAEESPPVGQEQVGEATFFERRRPLDSRLDVDKTIAEQFDLLRVVDNEKYPAFFEYRGEFYRLQIEKFGKF